MESGQVATLPFSACSVEQLRQALRRKRKPASSKPLPAEVVGLEDQYRAAVTGRFPKGVPVKVQVRNHKGKAVLDFKGPAAPGAPGAPGAEGDPPGLTADA